MNPVLYIGAVFAGTVYGLAFDPIAIIVGLLVGVASFRWWQPLIAALLSSAVLTVAIRATHDVTGGMALWWIIGCRAVVILGWAIPILAARMFLKRGAAQSSSGSA